MTSDALSLIRVAEQILRGDQLVRPLMLLVGRVDNRPYCERCIPIERDQGEVAMLYHNSRAPGQRAKMGYAYS
jgi:hypothetical protein